MKAFNRITDRTRLMKHIGIIINGD